MVKIAVFRVAKLDRGLWKYVSVTDLIRVGIGNLVASAVSCVSILLLAPHGFPRSIFALDFLVCFLAASGLRITVRIINEAASNSWSRKTAGKNTLIYGAGDAGITLLKEIRNNPKLLYRVVGFVDDELGKKGMRIAGVTVLGGGEKSSRW